MRERKLKRSDIAATSRYREGHGLVRSVEVTDLSEKGCGLKNAPHRLSKGTTVSIQIGDVGPIHGVIRWCQSGQNAGVEFIQPLTQATLQRLKEENATQPDPEILFR